MSFIADRRKELGMTQRDVSIASGITEATISKMERGKFNPSAKVLLKVSGALKCNPIDILNDLNL
ncbi:MAG: helix-turn-helix transcriptional regulator [Synergistaceae bacterium]|nr:helix-turn-helix transcriptional regulator [Synergistaceae bacterium]